MLSGSPSPDGAETPRRFVSGRLAWRAIAWLVAGALTWLLLEAYRNPAFMLDIANWRIC